MTEKQAELVAARVEFNNSRHVFAANETLSSRNGLNYVQEQNWNWKICFVTKFVIMEHGKLSLLSKLKILVIHAV